MKLRLEQGSVVADRYRIGEKLGSGGQGAVFLATDTQKDEICALKLLFNRAEAPNPDSYRLKREFRAAARLNHPCCVRVLDFGEHAGTPFFTMEFVRGGDLSRHDWKDPLDIGWLALQTLAALDHIHAKHVIHQDIKPANILIEKLANRSQFGFRVKLSDFGIAQVGGVDASMHRGQRMGTLRFMAPESVRGNPVDPRADLYSVGLIFYALLSGGEYPVPRPTDGITTQEWLLLLKKTPPLPLDALDAEIAEPLANCVMRMVQHDPAQRFESAASAFECLWSWYETEGDPSLRATLPPLQRKAYLSVPPFLGRHRELAAIDDLVEGIQAGVDPQSPVLMVVSGESGIGKSRLVNELVHRAAAADVAVVLETCSTEASSPYRPLRFLLRLCSPPETTTQTPDTGEAASGHGETVPLTSPAASGHGETVSLTSSPRAESSLASTHAEGMVWHFYDSIAAQLLELGRKQPVLIIIEDLQWADAPTLNLLGFLLRSIQHHRNIGVPMRVGFVITHRLMEEEQLLEFRQMADAQVQTSILDLKPLTKEAAERFLASTLAIQEPKDAHPLAEELFERTGGNPLFMTQVLQSLVATGRLAQTSRGWDLSAVKDLRASLPRTIAEAVGDQAERLAATTNLLLSEATIIGRQFNIEILLAISAADEFTVLDSLDEAIRAGFIEDLGKGEFRFTHDWFRETVYESLPEPQVRRTHQGIAEEMVRRCEAGAAAQIAHHFWEAHCREPALHWSEAAGHEAMQERAYAQAAMFFDRALKVSDELRTPVPTSLWEAHGNACLQCDRHKSARRSFDQLLELVEDPLGRSDIHRKLAEIKYRAGDTAGAVETLEGVLRLLQVRMPRSPMGFSLAILFKALRFVLGLPFLARPRRRLRDQRLAVVARTCFLLTETCFHRGDLKYRATYFQLRGLEIARRLGGGREYALAVSQQAVLMGLFGLHRLSRRYFDRLYRDEDVENDLSTQADVAVRRALVAAAAGRAQEAISWSDAAAKYSRKCGDLLPLRLSLFLGASSETTLGKLQSAREHANELIQIGHQLEDKRALGWGRGILGRVALHENDYPAADRLLREAIGLVQDSRDQLSEYVFAGWLTFVMTLQGDLHGAATLGQHATREAERLGSRTTGCPADGVFMAAVAMLRRDSDERATEFWDDAHHVRGSRRRFARAMRYILPHYLVGAGALLMAGGRINRGKKMIADAVEHTSRLELTGELWCVHAIAARVFPDGTPERDEHQRAADALQATMGASALSGDDGALPRSSSSELQE